MYSPSIHPLLEQPSTPCALSILQYVLVLGFTFNSSPFRLLGIIPMLSYVFLAFRNCELHRHTTHQLFLTTPTVGTIAIAFQYLDSALLSRWTYSTQGPTSALGGQKNLQTDPHKSPGSWTSKLVFGWEEAFRARSASSPWEVPNVPKFYPADKHPNRLPTKAQFLGDATLRCLMSFCLVDLIGWMGRDASMNPVNFASERVPLVARWRDVTGEELVLRFVSSVSYWASNFCVLQMIYYGTAIVVVGAGWGKIERWPPLFNRVTGCWSRFVAPAHLLTFSVLGVQHDTFLARYTLILLTFIISGILHQLSDLACGVPWMHGGAIHFFTMQAFGIMLEDAVQAMYRSAYGRKRTNEKPEGWKLWFGSGWVLLWLFWTTPLWAYPIMQRWNGEGAVPFSVLSSAKTSALASVEMSFQWQVQRSAGYFYQDKTLAYEELQLVVSPRVTASSSGFYISNQHNFTTSLLYTNFTMEKYNVDILHASSSFEGLIDRCTPISPHANSSTHVPPADENSFFSFGARLLLALAPKYYGIELDDAGRSWAENYGKACTPQRPYTWAFNLFLHIGGQPGDILPAFSLRFLMFTRTADQMAKLDHEHSTYRFYIAYKTCLLRAVLESESSRESFLRAMRAVLKRFSLKRWGTGSEELECEVTELADIGREFVALSGFEWKRERIKGRGRSTLRQKQDIQFTVIREQSSYHVVRIYSRPTDDPSPYENVCTDYQTCHDKGERYWWELQAVLGSDDPHDRTDGNQIFDQDYASEFMSLDYQKPSIAGIRPDVEGHGYEWNNIRGFGTYSIDPQTGEGTEETAYVNMFYTAKGLVVAVENYRDMDEVQTLPYSELVYQTWQVARESDDELKSRNPGFPGGAPISTLSAMVQLDVRNDESVDVLEAIWTARGLEWNVLDRTWYRFTVRETPGFFLALLGTVNVKGAVFLLKDHAVEIGRKTVTEIWVRWPGVNPDIWIAVGPNTPVAGAILRRTLVMLQFRGKKVKDPMPGLQFRSALTALKIHDVPRGFDTSSIHVESRGAPTYRLAYCGCLNAPPYLEDTAPATCYCSAVCQKYHWTQHKDRCKLLQRRKMLHRAAKVIQELYYILLRKTWIISIEKVDRVDKHTLFVHTNDRGLSGKKFILRDFSPGDVSASDELVALTMNKCNSSLVTMERSIQLILKEIMPFIFEISTVALNRTMWAAVVFSDGTFDFDIDRSPSRPFVDAVDQHDVFLVMVHSPAVGMMANPERYAIDLTHAQYGHHDETLMPWRTYMETRVHESKDVLPLGQARVTAEKLLTKLFGDEGIRIQKASLQFEGVMATAIRDFPNWMKLWKEKNEVIYQRQVEQMLQHVSTRFGQFVAAKANDVDFKLWTSVAQRKMLQARAAHVRKEKSKSWGKDFRGPAFVSAMQTMKARQAKERSRWGSPEGEKQGVKDRVLHPVEGTGYKGPTHA
ncbi:MAG: hypothetical protein Q9169_004397 [Polycauliona sp. 2 TL-2023]